MKSQKYDSGTLTMWVYRSFDNPMTLVPKVELDHWCAVLKDGKTVDGHPVKFVNYVFADEQTAAYNYQAMTFVNLGTYLGTEDNHKRYISKDGEPSFEPREDFGID